MAKMLRPDHAIQIAAVYIRDIKMLIDEWGDEEKWRRVDKEAEERGASDDLTRQVARASQVVQLSHYAVEIVLKVLYQQDYDSAPPREVTSRDHPLIDLYGDLKEMTREVVEMVFAERGSPEHGDLFPYGDRERNFGDVLAVCEGKYNAYRYHIFERKVEDLDLGYDFTILDVLRALVTAAKSRSAVIMDQDGRQPLDKDFLRERDVGKPVHELDLFSTEKDRAIRELENLPTDEPFRYGYDQKSIEQGIEISRDALLKYVDGWPDDPPRPNTEIVLVLEKHVGVNFWNVAIFSMMEGEFDRFNAEQRVQRETKRLLGYRQG